MRQSSIATDLSIYGSALTSVMHPILRSGLQRLFLNKVPTIRWPLKEELQVTFDYHKVLQNSVYYIIARRLQYLPLPYYFIMWKKKKKEENNKTKCQMLATTR